MSDIDRLPLSAPPLDVDHVVSADQLLALLGRVQEKWTRLGSEQPHFSVNAQDAFRPETIEQNITAFRQSGIIDLGELLEALRRHGFTRATQAHAFDFGCGVGRVSLPMAAIFQRVTACDISSSHMTVARIEAARIARTNLVFSLVNTTDFGMTQPFDVWYSRLVLQHNPPPVIGLILTRMFNLLAPGGMAMFQVPTYRVGYGFAAGATLDAPPPAEDFEIHAMSQAAIFDIARSAGCIALEVREDGAIWPPSLVTSNTFVFGKPWPGGTA